MSLAQTPRPHVQLSLRQPTNASIGHPLPLRPGRLIRLLLVKENFLQCSGIFHATNKQLDKSDIERIFNSYDRVSLTYTQHLPARLQTRRDAKRPRVSAGEA